MKFRRQELLGAPAFVVEAVESRTLLSSTLSPNLIVEHADTSSADIQGYTPAQISQAYGFNKVEIGNGSTTADGAGQTIAIVDAYNDPKVAADLTVFDTQFGLPAATLKVVNQTGGSSLPKTDSGWAGEIAMDVEWAHAIAPGAKLLLVETNTDNTDDLMAGVVYARSAAGVSVVSLSWGGSEYGTFSGGGESSTQLTYDADFTTPAGHTGITFVAASGDDGPQGGAEWPASSTNVLAVGGTSLNTSDDTGTYSSETAWSDSSGGYSTVETEPIFQDAVQKTGSRSTPDVSYDADPNTGFAVYDSVTDQGVTGWQEEGGTSAGTPQWSALIAIADQARELGGSSTLSGANQTLPILYSLYDAPATTAYSSYTEYFNDVTSGGSFGRHGEQATAGYDTLTGLGSPNAPAIVDALAGVAYGGRTGSSSGNDNTPASPFSATLIGDAPATGVIGSTSAGALSLKITNVSGAAFKGPVTISVSLSTDGVYSVDDPIAFTRSYANFALGKNASKRITLKLSYGSTLSDGSYTPVAEVTAIDTASAAAEAVDSSSIALAAPTVDLSPSFTADPVDVKTDKPVTVTVRIINTGNSTAIGTIGLTVSETTDGLLDSSSVALASIANRKIHIAAGKYVVLHLRLSATTDMPGSYSLLASLTSSTNPADTNAANDTVLTATALA